MTRIPTSVPRTLALCSVAAFSLAVGSAAAQDQDQERARERFPQQAHTEELRAEPQEIAELEGEGGELAEQEALARPGESERANARGASEIDGERIASVQNRGDAEIIVKQRPPEVVVEQREPEIIIQQRAPDVQVRVPEPEVSIQQQQPEIILQEQKPDVAIAAGKAEAEVIRPEGAEVKVLEPEGEQADVAVEAATGADVPVREEEQVGVRALDQRQAAEPDAREVETAAQESAADLEQYMDREVFSVDGDPLGEVGEVVRGVADQQLYLVIEYGSFLGLGEKQVVVPLEQVQLGTDRVILNESLGEAGLDQLAGYEESQYEAVTASEDAVG